MTVTFAHDQTNVQRLFTAARQGVCVVLFFVRCFEVSAQEQERQLSQTDRVKCLEEAYSSAGVVWV